MSFFLDWIFLKDTVSFAYITILYEIIQINWMSWDRLKNRLKKNPGEIPPSSGCQCTHSSSEGAVGCQDFIVKGQVKNMQRNNCAAASCSPNAIAWCNQCDAIDITPSLQLQPDLLDEELHWQKTFTSWHWSFPKTLCSSPEVWISRKSKTEFQPLCKG